MSRRLLLGLCSLVVVAQLGAASSAQENSPNPSLFDRFNSLKQTLKRKQPAESTQPPQDYSQIYSSEESDQQPAARRNAGRSSRGRVASGTGSSSGSALGKVSNFFTEGFFGSDEEPSFESYPDNGFENEPPPVDFSRRTAPPRAGSLPTDQTADDQPLVAKPKNPVRLSPRTSRENELQAALEDLLPQEDAAASDESAQDALADALEISPAEEESVPAATLPHKSNTFDLRQALTKSTIDDVIADAVAESTTESTADSASEAPSVLQGIDEIAKQAVADPAEPESSPEVEPAVVPELKAAPIMVEHRPQMVAAPPKVEAVVPVPRPETPIQLDDPFEGNPVQAFREPAEPANSMRSQSGWQAPSPSPATQSFSSSEDGLLENNRQPVIVSRVEGPRSVLVGREASYEVTLENVSNGDAEQIVARIDVPEWAELVDTMSSSGVVEQADDGKGAISWRLDRLHGLSSHTIRLRIIPRSGRPLQIGVVFTQAPVRTEALVEVQEPKLEMSIGGPEEVMFAQPQRYRLILRNPGTGITEGVVVKLVPPGGDWESATTQSIGNLAAGEIKEIELELTAREAGRLLMQASATAAGNLEARAMKKVNCRKPELEVDWRGPDKLYAGTEAVYYFRVRNPGTATTDSVEVSVQLPSEAEFIAASEGYNIDVESGLVIWLLGGVRVDEEHFLQIRCKLARPGANQVQLSAHTADGKLNDSKNFETQVVALADLKLNVVDPKGPLPVGEEATYEIHVKNRGTTSATGVSIVGLFSEGIDPTSVEGAQYTIRDGRVSFHPINSLAAGAEVVLKIHAKTQQAGTHIFRAEVVCADLDIKLAAEEATRFFEDAASVGWGDGNASYSAERDSSVNR